MNAERLDLIATMIARRVSQMDAEDDEARRRLQPGTGFFLWVWGTEIAAALRELATIKRKEASDGE